MGGARVSAFKGKTRRALDRSGTLPKLRLGKSISPNEWWLSSDVPERMAGMEERLDYLLMAGRTQ
jgi:hypothetical protein